MTASTGAALAEAADRLRRAGVATPRLDARLLLAAALGRGPEALIGYPERPLRPGEAASFESLLRRRLAREPVSRILGRREFWGLAFGLGPATLDPRPDSETLVEAALAGLPDRRAPLRLLDLGTGTGCLLLALLSELPNAWGVGIDRAPAAVAVARRNGLALGLGGRASFLVGDWGRSLRARFDLILCNPPYLRAAEIAALEPEVALFDPPAALSGGDDGLEAYRALMPDLARLLALSGRAILELGAGQRDAVQALARSQGLALQGEHADLSGRIRCVAAVPAAQMARPGEPAKNCWKGFRSRLGCDP